METISSIVGSLSGFLYNPWVPVFLLCAGAFFTVITRGVQLRMLAESLRVVSETPRNLSSVSSFGALMTSTASRVGTGNIVGVSTAICLGGPGAVFWMWMTAILGGASAYVESTLAQIYKRRDKDGSFYGGPSFYMESALGMRTLGVIFAVIVILTYAVGYNMLAAYNLQSSFVAFSFYDASSSPIVLGAIIACAFGLSVLFGMKSITKIASILVPLMSILYIGVALVVMAMNIGNIPNMFVEIFRGAFDFEAIFGGFAGSALMYGIKRGLYSNEAGMGSAPNAAASADVAHPATQGLVQMLSVFLDTIVICSATAFMCMSTGIDADAKLAGIPYVQKALESQFGSFGEVFIVVAMVLFAFTTLIGNYYYCEGCLKNITRNRVPRALLLVFRIAATVLVLVGSCISMGLAWDTADLLQAMMVIINIPVILILWKPAIAALRDYERQRAAGKKPTFKAANIGLAGKTDCWN